MFHVSPVCSLVHSLHVEIWPEKAQFAVHASVGLHALIQLLSVVEHLAGWAQTQVGVLTYPRLAPAPALSPADCQPGAKTVRRVSSLNNNPTCDQ